MKVVILLLSWSIISSALPCPFATKSLSPSVLFSSYCQYEAKFIHELGIDSSTGFAISNIPIIQKTGLPENLKQAEKISSFQVESIHIALLIKALQLSEHSNEFYTQQEALRLLDRKIIGYQEIMKDGPQMIQSVSFKKEGFENMYLSVLALNKLLLNNYPEQHELRSKWIIFQKELEGMNLDLKVQYCIDSAQIQNDPVQFYCQWIHLFLPTSYYSSSFKAAETQKLYELNSSPYNINGLNAVSKDFFSPRSLMLLLSLDSEEKYLAWSWLQYILKRKGGQSRYGSVSEGACQEGVCYLRWEDKVAPIIGMMGGLRELVEDDLGKIIQDCDSTESKYSILLPVPAPLFSPPSFRDDFISCRSTIFPSDFLWGVSTSAYQIEGGYEADGKGQSILDKFYHYDFMRELDNADVANDFYHRYAEQIEVISELGINSMRLSISWSRVLPEGTIDNVNQKGVDFYINVFTELRNRGIEPAVTLYHFDLPQALEDRGGWLNSESQEWFEQYADFCFETFGEYVKNWATINEPSHIAMMGYADGLFAPGRCDGISEFHKVSCAEMGGIGDSSTEPYIVVHNIQLSHAKAVKVYKTKYQDEQKGVIGYIAATEMPLPYNNTNPNDQYAVEKYFAFNAAWNYDSIVLGDYPDLMKTLISDNRLPEFTEDEKQLLRENSGDFLGLNYYTCIYVQHIDDEGNSAKNDGRYVTYVTNITGETAGDLISSWQIEYPEGLKQLLKWMDERYNHPKIIIFETGYPKLGIFVNEEDLLDGYRARYLKKHIKSLSEAISEEGVDVGGFFVWTAMDSYTFNLGYRKRFGLIQTYFLNNNTLAIRQSGHWYNYWINKAKNMESFDESDESE